MLFATICALYTGDNTPPPAASRDTPEARARCIGHGVMCWGWRSLWNKYLRRYRPILSNGLASSDATRIISQVAFTGVFTYMRDRIGVKIRGRWKRYNAKRERFFDGRNAALSYRRHAPRETWDRRGQWRRNPRISQAPAPSSSENASLMRIFIGWSRFSRRAVWLRSSIIRHHILECSPEALRIDFSYIHFRHFARPELRRASLRRRALPIADVVCRSHIFLII